MTLSLFQVPVVKTVVISQCDKYRYRLIRDWTLGEEPRVICWVMLNPSTADHRDDDPTIRRCLGFSAAWGYTRLVVVNLYGYRATDPKELLNVGDPFGPQNELWMTGAMDKADTIVAAWGTRGKAREPYMRSLPWPFQCLGTTKDGHPKHPLYVHSDTKLRSWS